MTRTRTHFTLLEVVMAAVILVGLSMALFAYSNTTAKSWQQLQVRKNQLDELLGVDRAVQSIIPNIIPFLWPDESQKITVETPFIIANQDSLRCAYLHRLNDLQEGAIRFCEIALQDQQLVVTYSDRPFMQWQDAGERVWKAVLAENVRDLRFEYADWDSKLVSDNWNERLFWTSFWDNMEVERYDVPLAVKMTLEFQDGRTYTWLRRTMGNGYRERFGKWEAQDEKP